jgi:hypothetical protein
LIPENVPAGGIWRNAQQGGKLGVGEGLQAAGAIRHQPLRHPLGIVALKSPNVFFPELEAFVACLFIDILIGEPPESGFRQMGVLQFQVAQSVDVREVANQERQVERRGGLGLLPPLPWVETRPPSRPSQQTAVRASRFCS